MNQQTNETKYSLNIKLIRKTLLLLYYTISNKQKYIYIFACLLASRMLSAHKQTIQKYKISAL